jgi:hypothetical protein
MLVAGYVLGVMFRIIIALHEGFTSWNWIRLNGIVTVLLGLAICGQWFSSGLPVPGLLIYWHRSRGEWRDLVVAGPWRPYGRTDIGFLILQDPREQSASG